MADIVLRDVVEADVPVFFEQQTDPAAIHMAAFTGNRHADRDAFFAKWTKILGDPATTKQTILVDDRVAGNMLVFELCGLPSVGYWLGREYWGRGIATQALAAFLSRLSERPLYARVAWDNAGSIRVLEKCGFSPIGRERAFANARGEEIEEVIFVLEATSDRDLDHRDG